MKRFAGAIVLTATIAAVLSGCTAPPAPSADAVATWVQAQANAKAATGTGTIGTGSSTSDGGTSDDPGEGISLSAADGTPFTVTDVDVRCYGAESLPVRWELETKTGSVGVENEPVKCDKKPHPLSAHHRNVTKVTVNGLQTPTPTGWFITVRGIPTPTDDQLGAWATKNEKKVADAVPAHTLMAGLLDAAPGGPDNASSLSKTFSPRAVVTSVQVACYGAPTMRVRLTVSGPTRDNLTPMSVHTTEPIPCDRTTHVAKLSIPDAAEVQVVGTDVRTATRYLVFVTGTQK